MRRPSLLVPALLLAIGLAVVFVIISVLSVLFTATTGLVGLPVGGYVLGGVGTLMVVRFLECKGWLVFDGRRDYLRALFAAGGFAGQSFYRGRLWPLLFEIEVVPDKAKPAADNRPR